MIRDTVTHWSGDTSSAAPAIVFGARVPFAPPWHSGRKQGTSKRHGGVTRRKVTMMFDERGRNPWFWKASMRGCLDVVSAATGWHGILVYLSALSGEMPCRSIS
jgi:hypothetical protein